MLTNGLTHLLSGTKPWVPLKRYRLCCLLLGYDTGTVSGVADWIHTHSDTPRLSDVGNGLLGLSNAGGRLD